VLERDIEQAANRKARKAGWVHVKQGAMGTGRGWPDQLYLQRGTYVWIEYKQPGKSLTPLQEKRHKELLEQRALVYVSTAAVMTMVILNRHSWWRNADDL
jgi:hypothetical protein